MGLWSTGFLKRMEEMGLYQEEERHTSRCGVCDSVMDPYKRDCLYFSEEHTMEGSIRTCSKEKEFGKCPCEGCKKYLSKAEVIKLVEKARQYELEKSFEESPDRMNGGGY